MLLSAALFRSSVSCLSLNTEKEKGNICSRLGKWQLQHHQKVKAKAPSSLPNQSDLTLYADLESSLSNLSLKPQSSKSSTSFRRKQDVADSWEDEDPSSSEESDQRLAQQQSTDYPAAPPPTPISPTTSFASRESFTGLYGYINGTDEASDPRTERSNTRPEKTDAVAKRLIAGALGVRAPKKTDEQMAYDRAIKEKEVKRRNQEKEAAMRAKEDAERAKIAVWSD